MAHYDSLPDNPQRLSPKGEADFCQDQIHFAKYIAKQFYSQARKSRSELINFDDLYSAAMEGLAVAAKSYDPSRYNPEIDSDPIKHANRYARLAIKTYIIREIRKLSRGGLTNPRFRSPMIPSVHLMGDSEESTRIEDPLEHDDQSQQLDIMAMLDTLPDRDKTVLSLYYLEKLTDREIGEQFGLTGDRIGQIRRTSLAKLREQFGGLEDFGV